MPTKRDFQFWGSGPVCATRQASVIALLGGALAVIGSVAFPGARLPLLVAGIGTIVIVPVLWLLPWQRWNPLLPAVTFVFGIPGITVTTWGFGAYSMVTAPFLLVMLVWLGLHFPGWVRALVVPLAAAGFVAGLALTQDLNVVIGLAFMLLPVMIGVAELVARQVDSIERTRDELDRVAQWRAALTATLAHDVRSPLTALELAVETLADEDLPQAQRHTIAETAQRQAHRITKLATGLLDLERVDTTGALRLDIDEVNVREAVESALNYLPANQATVDIDGDLVAELDSERFEEIVFNLSNNAIRHAGPPVHISASTEEGWLNIAFRDYGPGVPDEVLPQLFGRFTSHRNGKSVGLGLWIVRQLCQAHGGDVRYEPADPGARFVVTLPTTQRSSSRTEQDAATAS
ncbi:signal transduction histidine kinase [Saccharomonospora amisosensis]|uniref:histidine kinase n=1 Tax=Saccharomonospora amisosensis TaxID=1128677 RepID=A0A7X5UMR6_9PSEU|nr:HAMP domain-containing sensor histidine kinase [Saccharomonospora amisosensis]NIJ10582.1 signal transduction histidine kinase [Saccharomonospora amisosensis]